MDAVSDTVDSIARKSLTAILNAVERVGQNTIAEGCEVDSSTITGDKAKYWPRFAKTLAIAGLKVVPVTVRCYAPESIEPLLQLAKQRLAQMQSLRELEWEDAP
jgi:hypothetical protein